METPPDRPERDRSTRCPSPEEISVPGERGERSRSLVPRRITRLVPGGRITCVLLALAVFPPALSAFVAQPFRIPSGSMEPVLAVGDRVLANKLAYRFDDRPMRGDIVVFDGTGHFGDGVYVKRVVGVGGDRVTCCDEEGRLRVNGRSVDESTFLHPGDSASAVDFDVRVPEGRLFLLGDHRSASRDSRDLLGSPGGGMVPADRVIGRADWIVWPRDHASRLERSAGPPSVGRLSPEGLDQGVPEGPRG
ncbi:signal peptidase I [Streptomyces sp. ZYX-F-203]